MPHCRRPPPGGAAASAACQGAAGEGPPAPHPPLSLGTVLTSTSSNDHLPKRRMSTAAMLLALGSKHQLWRPNSPAASSPGAEKGPADAWTRNSSAQRYNPGSSSGSLIKAPAGRIIATIRSALQLNDPSSGPPLPPNLSSACCAHSRPAQLLIGPAMAATTASLSAQSQCACHRLTSASRSTAPIGQAPAR